MIEIRNAGVKGLGIFATEIIQPGTRLLAEKPLFIVHSERQVFAASRRLSDIEHEHFRNLSVHPVKKSAVLSWAQAVWHALAPDQYGQSSTNPTPFWASVLQYPTLLEVFRNNNFDIGNGNFNQTLNKFTIHAVQAIEPGQEITISYLREHGALKEHRQGRLRHSYGFLCDCPACDATTTRGREGEAKRVGLQERLHAFAEDAEQGRASGSSAELEVLEAMLGMYESEGIVGREIATMHIAAGELALKLGRKDEARRHAERGLKLDEEASGDDSDLFQDTFQKYSKIIHEMQQLR